MGRLLALALVLAAAAGGATIALGGVDPRPEDEAAGASAPAGSAPATKAPSRRKTSEATAARKRVGATVVIDDLAFGPKRVTVRAGRAVRWVNRDDIDHLVYAEERAGNGAPDFASNRIRPGGSFVAAPSGPGTYRYVCTLHPTVMMAVVRVTR